MAVSLTGAVAVLVEEVVDLDQVDTGEAGERSGRRRHADHDVGAVSG